MSSRPIKHIYETEYHIRQKKRCTGMLQAVWTARHQRKTLAGRFLSSERTEHTARFPKASSYRAGSFLTLLLRPYMYRFHISKAPNFTSTPSKGLLQPMQSQNTVSERMSTLTAVPWQQHALRTTDQEQSVGNIFSVWRCTYCGAKIPIFRDKKMGSLIRSAREVD